MKFLPSHLRWAVLALCLYLAAALPGSATAAAQFVIHYVKPGAHGACTSWTDACDLQTALGKADSGDWVWVTGGIYYPTTGADRTASFQIPHDVKLFGGFPESGSYLEERDWVAHPSILSGDIGAPDVHSDNSYHVVTGKETGAKVALDGFTITSGNANEFEPFDRLRGGGLYIQDGSVTLNHVTFTNNSAIEGGGMYSEQGSANLNDVTFSDNSAEFGGGINSCRSSFTLNNVTFLANQARVNDYGGGGGMMQTGASSTSTLNNITFSGNKGKNGGGFWISGGSANFTNATIFNNSAEIGGGIYIKDAAATLTNSIVWGNTAGQIDGDADVTYSDIQGGEDGEKHNIDADPLLAPLDLNGGFSLTHALADGSPAIDAGTNSHCPAQDQRGLPRPIDGDADGTAICDMGAVEYRAATLTTLASAPDPSLAGRPFQVTVQVTSPLEPPVSGEVTITVDGNPAACSALLSAGEGSCELVLPAPGTYNLTASYPGSGSFGPSQDSKTHTVEARLYFPLIMK